MKKTALDKQAAYRTKINKTKEAANVIMPWLNAMTERGRNIAATSISELDITARYDDIEDKVIALTASLAVSVGSEAYVSSPWWDIASPTDMVRKRLFTELPRCGEKSFLRFQKIMDIMWQWTQDYSSVYDALDSLQNEPDPVGTLKWMMGDDDLIPQAEHRIPRYLMALMLCDGGIGQGLIPYSVPEDLTAPECKEIKRLCVTFVHIRDIEYGEMAYVLGLQYETDLYYMALGWQDLCERYPHETKLIKARYARLQDCGAKDSTWRQRTKQLFKMMDI